MLRGTLLLVMMSVCCNCCEGSLRPYKFGSVCPNIDKTIHEALIILGRGTINVPPVKDKREEDRFLCRPCAGLLGRAVKALEGFTDQLHLDAYLNKLQGQVLPQQTPAPPRRMKRVIRTPLAQKLKTVHTTKKAATTFISFLRRKIRTEMLEFVKKTTLRQQIKSLDDLPNVSVLDSELRSIAPTTYAATKAISCRKTVPTMPMQAFAGFSVLVHARSRKCNRFQKLVAFLLMKNRASEEVCQQFNKFGLSVAKQTINTTLKTLSVSFDSRVIAWRDEIDDQLTTMAKIYSHPRLERAEQTTATQITELSTGPTAKKRLRFFDGKFYSLQFVIDNINKSIRRRGYSSRSRSVSLDMTSYIGARSRIPLLESDIFEESTNQNLSDFTADAFEITPADHEKLQEEHRVLIKRILVDNLAIFSEVRLNKNERHIPHMYSNLSRGKSETVNLGIIMENENTSAGMVKILQTLQQYHPTFPNGDMMEVLTFGDGLTAKRIQEAIALRSMSTYCEEFLCSSVPAIGHWHRRNLVFTDHMKTLLKDPLLTVSPGTLPSFRQKFKGHSKATLDTKKTFNETFRFSRFAGNAYITAFVCRTLGLSGPLDCPEEYLTMSKEEIRAKLEELTEAVLQFEWHNLQKTTCNNRSCVCRRSRKAHSINGKWFKCSNSECDIDWFHSDCYTEEQGCTDQYTDKACDDDEELCADHYTDQAYENGEKLCTDHYTGQTSEGEEEECTDHNCGEEEGNEEQKNRIVKTRKKVETTFWYCSSKCRDARLDKKLAYSKALIFCFLLNEGLRDAVRENDGPRIIVHTKLNLIQYINKRHHIYKNITINMLFNLLCHPSAIVRHDLLWNTTVNVVGGVGKNIANDLYNEFVNKVLKLFVFASNTPTNENSVIPLSRSIGILQEINDKIKNMLAQDNQYNKGSDPKNWKVDVAKAAQIIIDEDLLSERGRRHHHGFENFNVDYLYIKDIDLYRSAIENVLRNINAVKKCEREKRHEFGSWE